MTRRSTATFPPVTTDAVPPPTGPLRGIRVVDLSAVMSGPLGTAMLADQGADVIMVEQVRMPDIVRQGGPLVPEAQGVSAYFAALNRNKRSIALDLRQAEGRELLEDLVRRADVVVQNFRPGALDRLGVGWDRLSAINPSLVMCSVSGFGPDGPYERLPAFDPTVQAIAAYPAVQAGAGGRPALVATAVCDKVTALNVAQAICAALVARANGAGGQHIELSMLEASIHFLWPEGMWNHTYLDHETDQPDLSEIYQLYPSADGWVMIYPTAKDEHWQAMSRAFGREDLRTDPRFADRQGRIRHGEVVNVEITAETVRRTTAEIVELLVAADVPVARVNSRDEMIADPQVQARGILVETVHPTAGRLRQARPPAIFSATPSSLRRHAPTFAEHTDEVLREVLDLADERLAELRERGVIA